MDNLFGFDVAVKYLKEGKSLRRRHAFDDQPCLDGYGLRRDGSNGAGAVTVLENGVDAVKCYKKAKDTLRGRENNESCGD